MTRFSIHQSSIYRAIVIAGEQGVQLRNAVFENHGFRNRLLQIGVYFVDHIDGVIDFGITAGGIGADVDQIFRLAISGQSLFESAVEDLPVRPRSLWGRRTLFHLAGKPLLVNEIFLPGIPLTEDGDNATP